MLGSKGFTTAWLLWNAGRIADAVANNTAIDIRRVIVGTDGEPAPVSYAAGQSSAYCCENHRWLVRSSALLAVLRRSAVCRGMPFEAYIASQFDPSNFLRSARL
jgi:hypothetical protein